MYSLGYAIQMAVGCMAMVAMEHETDPSTQEILDCMDVIRDWYQEENIKNAD